MGGGPVFWMILGGWALLAISLSVLLGTWLRYRNADPSPPPYCLLCGRPHREGESQR